MPFTGQYRPLGIGLGVVAIDLLAALIVTSLLRQRIGYRIWRAVHWSAYACWPVRDAARASSPGPTPRRRGPRVVYLVVRRARRSAASRGGSSRRSRSRRRPRPARARSVSRLPGSRDDDHDRDRRLHDGRPHALHPPAPARRSRPLGSSITSAASVPAPHRRTRADRRGRARRACAVAAAPGFPTATKMEAVRARRRPPPAGPHPDRRRERHRGRAAQRQGQDAARARAAPRARRHGRGRARGRRRRGGRVRRTRRAAGRRRRCDARSANARASTTGSRCGSPRTPTRYVVGEETALVNWLNGGDAKPTFTPPRPFERGVDRRPTLVDNVETLAHVALIARFGAQWWRERGHADRPGHDARDAHRRRPSGRLRGAARHVAAMSCCATRARTTSRGVLVGGYFGTWLTPRQAAMVTLSADDLKAMGAGLGCGAIAVLRLDTCPLVELARVTRWLAEPVGRPVRTVRARPPGDRARRSSTWPNEPRPRRARAKLAARRWTRDGRRAAARASCPTARCASCRAASPCSPEHIAEHAARGPCAAAGAPAGAPGAASRRRRGDEQTRIALRVNPIMCVAHGLCAELFPERITLDDWGYPIIDGRPDPARARGARAPRAAAACPTLALLVEREPRANPCADAAAARVTDSARARRILSKLLTLGSWSPGSCSQPAGRRCRDRRPTMRPARRPGSPSTTTPRRSRSPARPRSGGSCTTPTAARSRRRTSSSSATHRLSGRHTVLFDSGDGHERAAVVRARARAPRSRPTTRTGGPSARRTAPARFGPYAPDAHFDTGLADADWHASWIRRAGVPVCSAAPLRRLLADPQGDQRRAQPDRARPRVRRRRPAVRAARQRVRASRTARRTRIPTSSTTRRPTSRPLVRPGAANTFAFVTHWATASQGRPASARGVHRAHHDRPRRRHPRGAHDRRVVAHPHRAVDPRRSPQRRRRLRRAHRRTARAARLGPARVRRPDVAAARSCSARTRGRRSRTSSRRAPTSSSTPATPVTLQAARRRRVRRRLRRGHVGDARGRRPPRRRRARREARAGDALDPNGHVSTHARRTRTPTCTGTSTSAPAPRSCGRSATSRSATSRSTARPRPLDRGRRDDRGPPRDLPDEHAASFATSEPDARRGLGPRPPLRSVRHAGAVPRHADAGEGPVPRRLPTTSRKRRWPRSANGR